VLFDVSSMPDYGKLSGRKLEEQQAGARVAVEVHKKNPGDFVLWKLSSPEEPGWESPWGRGRPGWHIECSVMSRAVLGEVFDIHGGGLDLIFPHHENEIAQSRCAHGTKVMANYWMHNGFLQVEGQKMSKSLGNFVTISELLSTNSFGGHDWDGQVLRLAMLRTHYRQPIDWTLQSLSEAEIALDDWVHGTRNAQPAEVSPPIIEYLLDDMNSHLAMTELYRLYRQKSYDVLAASMNFLGFNAATYRSGRRRSVQKAMDKVEIDRLISARLEARKAKDWKKSDEIRDELMSMGIQIKDVKDQATGEMKTEWEVKR
jgi:cysteinyl-tRNA synthetase